MRRSGSIRGELERLKMLKWFQATREHFPPSIANAKAPTLCQRCCRGGSTRRKPRRCASPEGLVQYAEVFIHTRTCLRSFLLAYNHESSVSSYYSRASTSHILMPHPTRPNRVLSFGRISPYLSLWNDSRILTFRCRWWRRARLRKPSCSG